MSVKKAGIIVLVCLFGIFTVSPAVSMAAPAGPASAGTAGLGATEGLSAMALLGLGALAVLGLAAIVVITDDDDDYSPPAHGAHH